MNLARKPYLADIEIRTTNHIVDLVSKILSMSFNSNWRAGIESYMKTCVMSSARAGWRDSRFYCKSEDRFIRMIYCSKRRCIFRYKE
ncbi:hypothetical protein CDAR_92281 [Caerostris darwini]|uniref:Uncharacterized protein n=1 Tax=Caerostris darwini TaxID=1538125 RepID=A0AAV4WZ95_9ARAC|nr:hypothetical protein CDAR_92281 [Caerostris darwini]